MSVGVVMGQDESDLLDLGCPRNSVDTEFRMFFVTTVYSVFRAELA
jgi:hypothetical protein